MNNLLHIVFCADRRVLAGLHVAAYSVLASHQGKDATVCFHLFVDGLTAADIALLHETLQAAGPPFRLEQHRIDTRAFARFPNMRGSWGTYFRLLAPEMLTVDRFTYLDVDIVCGLDVADFLSLDLGSHPAGFLAETTIQAGADHSLKARLPAGTDGPYFNAGVMVVDCPRWREQQVTERCFEFLQTGPAKLWDQTALNYVLRDNWQPLERRFNCIANWRSNWPAFKAGEYGGKIVHFLDHPKPWDLLGELLHPQYALWRSVLDRTKMRGFRSWQAGPGRKFPATKSAWKSYKKVAKDRLLFSGYSRGWFNRIKGVASD